MSVAARPCQPDHWLCHPHAADWQHPNLDYVIKAATRYRAFGPLVKLIEKIEQRTRATGYTF